MPIVFLLPREGRSAGRRDANPGSHLAALQPGLVSDVRLAEVSCGVIGGSLYCATPRKDSGNLVDMKDTPE